MLTGLIDAVFVFVDDVEFDDLKGVGAWVGGFRQVTTNDLDLDASLRSSATILDLIVELRS